MFINYLDPELVTFPFLFFTIATYVSKKYRLSYFYLFLATVLHPLYTLPLLLALFVSLFIQILRKKIRIAEAIRHSIIYVITVIPYTLFLQRQSHQSIQSIINPSMVMEIIRAPHHFVIPPFSPLTILNNGFFLYLISFSTITFLVWRYIIIKSDVVNYDFAKVFKTFKLNKLLIRNEVKPESISRNQLKENLVELSIINLALVSMLLLTSFVSSFVRISLLVNLTVYRIGVVVVVLTWIILISSLVNKLEIDEYRLKNVGKLLLRCCVVIILLFSVSKLARSYTTPERSMSSTQKEVISWVKTNTNSSDLFLSYIDFDIRTTCLRPSYFELKTVPLTADGQILWYAKYRNYFDIPQTIDAQEYAKISAYAKSKHNIDIARVAANSNAPIKYILISKFDAERNYILEVNNFKRVFENDIYEVYYKLS